MIDTHEFNHESPFKQTHNESTNTYNLTNTTQDLIKFQLQEQYRSALNVTSEVNIQDPSSSAQNSYPFQDPFNQRLQSSAALYPSLTNNVPSLSSTPTNTDVDEEGDTISLDAFLHSSKPNYMNLKILVENAAFDSSQLAKESILPIHEIQKLKQKVEEKLELQQYLLSKIALSQQFINEVVYKEDVENETLLRVIKTVSSLQSQLISNNEQLDDAREKVNNHNLSCMLLGYIEDVKRSRLHDQQQSEAYSDDQMAKYSNSVTSSPARQQQHNHLSPKLFESLSAHIASIAVQRNVTLAPPPTSNEVNVEAKVHWLQQCIDAILLKPATSQSTEDTSSIANHSMLEKLISTSPSSEHKTLSEYKTALADLKFSYQYLAKEYELSRLSSSKLIQDYRKKIDKLEKERGVTDLPSHLSSFSTTTSPSHSISLENKDKEISKLRKELHLLKVDNIGVSKHSSIATSLKYNSGDFSSPTVGKGSGTSDDDDVTSQILSVASKNPITTASGVSNGILRSEFKKIVSEMQDFYEQELAEERMLRRRLEENYNQMKNNNNNKKK